MGVCVGVVGVGVVVVGGAVVGTVVGAGAVVVVVTVEMLLCPTNLGVAKTGVNA